MTILKLETPQTPLSVEELRKINAYWRAIEAMTGR